MFSRIGINCHLCPRTSLLAACAPAGFHGIAGSTHPARQYPYETSALPQGLRVEQHGAIRAQRAFARLRVQAARSRLRGASVSQLRFRRTPGSCRTIDHEQLRERRLDRVSWCLPSMTPWSTRPGSAGQPGRAMCSVTLSIACERSPVPFARRGVPDRDRSEPKADKSTLAALPPRFASDELASPMNPRRTGRPDARTIRPASQPAQCAHQP